MTFQTGKLKTGGRSAGTPNKKTLARLNSLNRILKICEKKLEQDVEELSPSERIKLWKTLGEYTLPKLARAKTEPEEEGPCNIHLTQEIVYREIPDDELEEFQEAARNGQKFTGGRIVEPPPGGWS